MFVACGIWCLADVSSVSPSSEQTSHIQRTRPRRKTVLFKTSLRVSVCLSVCLPLCLFSLNKTYEIRLKIGPISKSVVLQKIVSVDQPDFCR